MIDTGLINSQPFNLKFYKHNGYIIEIKIDGITYARFFTSSGVLKTYSKTFLGMFLLLTELINQPSN